MLAVYMAYVREKSVSATAADLMRTDKWVYDWLKRFDAGGLDGLRDLPKSGRPASVPHTTMDRIIGKTSQGRCTPKEFAGARTHRDQRQTAHHVHQKDHARVRSDSQDPTEGPHQPGQQKGSPKLAVSLRQAGFTPRGGKDLPSRTWTRRSLSMTLYPAANTDPRGESGSSCHAPEAIKRSWCTAPSPRTAGSSSGLTSGLTRPPFIRYLKEMQRRFGKVAVVTDRASPHRAKLVKGLLRENKNIRIIYLPKGSPYLNAIEECWHQGKRILPVSVYYRDVCRHVQTRSSRTTEP